MYKPVAIRDHKQEFKRLIPKLPPGDIAEFGTYEGGSAIALAEFNRTVYVFDTFQGMPSSPLAPYDPQVDYCNPPGKFNPQQPIKELLSSNYPNIICVEGIFQETLPKLDPKVKFIFVYLDCDWYSSYMFVVKELVNHVYPETIALVDDYRGCAGCIKAIDELCQEKVITYDKRTSILKWNLI